MSIFHSSHGDPSSPLCVAERDAVLRRYRSRRAGRPSAPSEPTRAFLDRPRRRARWFTFDQATDRTCHE